MGAATRFQAAQRRNITRTRTAGRGGNQKHEHEGDPHIITLRRVTAERRAEELVRALRNAVTGASHWRLEATRLLELIDNGVLPKP